MHKRNLGYAIFFFVCFSSNPLWPQSLAVESVAMTVSDMDRALDFYTHVLPFRKLSDEEWTGDNVDRTQGIFGVRVRIVRLQLGREIVELWDYRTPGGRPSPVDTRSNDLWFQHIAIVVSDMEKAYAHLRAHNVQYVSTNPQTIPASNKAAAGIKAFYFRDPDAHNLELIYFPPGKGQSRWHDTTALFLGIDHTAIGISNTTESVAFYRDELGLKLAGESWNSGIEQERLNNVFGASLHISGYRASEGPGVEFLEYLAPRTGRRYPDDSRADDLWHWETTIRVADPEALFQKLRETYRVISTSVTAWTDGRRRFLVRDPDGHVIRITGP